MLERAFGAAEPRKGAGTFETEPNTLTTLPAGDRVFFVLDPGRFETCFREWMVAAVTQSERSWA